MALLQRFDPPAFMTDYDGIPGQREAWHNFVSRCFAVSIAGEANKVLKADGSSGAIQFYNPAATDPGGPVVAQAILWNAFPKELLRRWGRARAMVEADRLYPLRHYHEDAGQGSPGFEAALYRPQDEYCEWHVVRDPDTNKIIRVIFSSEPPEYWEAMFGTPIDPGDGAPLAFPGDRQRVLALYRALVGPQVAMNDLICDAEIRGPDGSVYVQQGQYNPYNKWNTTHGIVHLCAPPNALTAEIQLGADATVLYRNGRGEPVVEPSALICCAGFGGPDRNSDPTIGATVNALARAGAMVTLPNPVGLYMDHIDLAGWQAPEGVRVADCVRVERGTPGMIERLVVEVPGPGAIVGDLTIGGEPIVYGGQIAECITVKLIGGAARLDSVHNAPTRCVGRCCIDPADPRVLGRPIGLSHAAPLGMQDALGGAGGDQGDPRGTAPSARAALLPHPRHRTRGGLL